MRNMSQAVSASSTAGGALVTALGSPGDSLKDGVVLNDTILYNDGRPLHTYGNPECPLWQAAEVCGFLGIHNHRHACSRLDEDEKMTVDLPDVYGRPQPHLMVLEPGLYALVGQSRKPEAKAFRRWVAHEVLPSIRRTGQYKRKREEEDPSAKHRTVMSDIITREMALLERLGHLEPRDKLRYADELRSLGAPQSAPAPPGAPGAPAIEAPQEMPISRWLQENGHGKLAAKRGFLIKAGRALSRAYREAHGSPPGHRTQWIDGAARQVAQYYVRDFEELGFKSIVDELIATAFLGGQKMCTLNKKTHQKYSGLLRTSPLPKQKNGL